jgi:hypothetical protein
MEVGGGGDDEQQCDGRGWRAADVEGGEGKATKETATNYSHTLAGHVLAPL